MCEQCMAEAVILIDDKPVIGEFFLVRATKDGGIMKNGEFGLVRWNDPDFIFNVTPEIEPPDDDTIENDDLYFAWLEKARNFQQHLSASNAGLNASYELVKGCIDAGFKYEIDGIVEYWLFTYLAQFIKEN